MGYAQQQEAASAAVFPSATGAPESMRTRPASSSQAVLRRPCAAPSSSPSSISDELRLPAMVDAATWYTFHYDFLHQRGYRIREGEAPYYTTQVESGMGPDEPARLRFNDGMIGACSNLTTSQYEGRNCALKTSRRHSAAILWCATRDGVGTQLTIRELPDRSPI